MKYQEMSYRQQLESNIRWCDRALKIYWIFIALVVTAFPLFILVEGEEPATEPDLPAIERTQ